MDCSPAASTSDPIAIALVFEATTCPPIATLVFPEDVKMFPSEML